VALAVYDIADRDSFKALEHWVKEIKENAPKNVMIVLVGNKTDLIDLEQVRYEDSKEFAKKIDARLFLVSAKDGKGINVKLLPGTLHCRGLKINPPYLVTHVSRGKNWSIKERTV
jgi:small GTP-binding protein